MTGLIWLLVVLVGLLLGLWWLLHHSSLRYRAVSRPARTYEDALEKFRVLQSANSERVNPLCCSAIYVHGQRTERCIVMLHGFTNCPHQFHQLARELHERGCNVIVPRLPNHGFEPMAEDLAAFRLEELLEAVEATIDIAVGLGEHVTVTGLSLGGTLACWIGMNRSDVARIVAISPAIGLSGIPPLRQQAIGNLLTAWPNVWRWWDAERKNQRVGPQHAYPRWATRSLAVLLRLGRIVQVTAGQRAPVVDNIMIVRNGSDDVISLEILDTVVNDWRAHGAEVQIEELPMEWALIHDLIDPTQAEAQIERVYPRLHRVLGLDDPVEA